MELIKRTCSFSLKRRAVVNKGCGIKKSIGPKDTVDLNKLGNKSFDFE